MRRVLILGGTSAIAEATAREFARRGDALFLAARSAERLTAITDDLKIRGATIAQSATADLGDIATHEPLIRHASETLGGLDTVLIAYGTLSNQRACEASVALALQELQTNAISVMSLCTLLANQFEAQGRGVIGVISSVAGDRGRQSNYVYGSAKAAVSAFTSGLRQRLYRKGVFVVTIKPGFVDTPMTAAFKKGPLWASADTVGRQIAKALIRGTPVLYTPGFWRLIMFVIRSVPEFIFRRLAL